MVQWTFPEGDRDYLRLIQRLPLDVGSVPHKQHVVSRAILKGFAAPGTSGHGWSLTPFNVALNEVQRDRGLKGCAYVQDFIVYAAQSAELAWKAVSWDKVDLFNELQVRNADAHVYFRPGSGLETFVRRIASIISPP